MNDIRTIALITGVLALLTAATAVGQFLKRHPDRGLDPAAVRTFNLRIRGWWVLCTVLAAAFWLGTTATVVLFGLVSFWALREFITLTPTRKGDHRALFWVFFAFTPLHYLLVGLNRYDIFSVFLPVYATLFVLARVAFAGDYKRFLERTAKIQAGLVVCVYCSCSSPTACNTCGAGCSAGGSSPRRSVPTAPGRDCWAVRRARRCWLRCSGGRRPPSNPGRRRWPDWSWRRWASPGA
jgi:phosphatidate cytidylyltransferase